MKSQLTLVRKTTSPDLHLGGNRQSTQATGLRVGGGQTAGDFRNDS